MQVRHSSVQRGLKRLFLTQTMVIIVAAIIAFWVTGKNAAISALLGGLVCLLPSLYFAATFFRHGGAHAAKKIVADFYKGEAVKLILAAALFTVIFKMYPVEPLALFATFIATQLVFWLAPCFFMK